MRVVTAGETRVIVFEVVAAAEIKNSSSSSRESESNRRGVFGRRSLAIRVNDAEYAPVAREDSSS